MEGIFWDVGGWPLEPVVEDTRKLTEQVALRTDNRQSVTQSRSES